MRIWTVHLPRGGTAPARAGRASAPAPVLVREGFAWGAFLFALPWLLLHRLWIEAIAYVGVGLLLAAFARGLAALPGMVETLEARVAAGTPLLGICVGMQIMAERGLEHGTTPGLGWIRGEMAPMAPRGADGTPLPLPQMGWNTLDF